MKLDVIVFASHPDDAELAMGGTVAKFIGNNLKVGIIDLTRGELSSRGTVETRQKEVEHSSLILKLTVRENLQIPDGAIVRNKENLMKIITIIRQYQPKIIFAPYFNDRHPDHIDTSFLVKEAMFASGLIKIKTKLNNIPQESYRPKKIFYYMQTYTFDPTFIFDITGYHNKKMESVKAYSTQFYDSENKEPQTFISRPEFMSYVESRALFYGFQIGKQYGEPFYSEEKIELDLVSLIRE
jgi:N-acetylglucosamine malate deacetylase 1